MKHTPERQTRTMVLKQPRAQQSEPTPSAESADAIVLVDHGSRRAEANEIVVETAARLSAAFPDKCVEPAHCEIASPTLEEAVARCLERGARHIVVQPYYLVPGRHSREDIPRIVGELARANPTVRFFIGDPLGVHDAFVSVLIERVATAKRLDSSTH